MASKLPDKFDSVFSTKGRGMDRRMMVKQYVAVVANSRGQRFQVFRTGDDKFYLFDPIDAAGCSHCMQFPVEKKRLRDDIRRALANGVGNA